MPFNPAKPMDMKKHRGFIIILETYPASNSYSNTVGTIDLREQGGYSVSSSGEIELREPYGTGALGEINGGYYANRE